MAQKVQNPVVLFVHGAWHRPFHYRLLIEAIQKQGFTVLAPPLASSGCDDSVDGKALNDDVKRIHDVVLPYIDSGRKVIAMGHSYGAVPLTVAIEGHSVAEREKNGLQGGFTSVVYLAPTPVLQKDISMYDSVGGKYTSHWFHDVSDTRLPLKIEKLKEALFSDLDQSVADEVIPTLCNQSKAPFEVPVACTPADLTIPKTVIICKSDPIFVKDILLFVADKWGAHIMEIEAGHSPHLVESHRKWLAELMVQEAEKHEEKCNYEVPSMATISSESAAPGIVDLISSYSILESLVPWLSTLDLFNLSLTSRSAYAYIQPSPKIFKHLSRNCLCDGRGLVTRQEYAAPYHRNRMSGRWDLNPHLTGDEEIEVRLYNIKCEEAGALPCLKCGINICEECRCYPRAAPPNVYPNRRPHLRGSFELDNIMCLCEECDKKAQSEVEGQFLNDRCDCDIYKRWICVRCEDEERTTTRKYFEERTQMEWDWMVREDLGYGDDCEPSKTLHDHAFERAFPTEQCPDASGANGVICQKANGTMRDKLLAQNIRSLTITLIILVGTKPCSGKNGLSTVPCLVRLVRRIVQRPANDVQCQQALQKFIERPRGALSQWRLNECDTVNSYIWNALYEQYGMPELKQGWGDPDIVIANNAHVIMYGTPDAHSACVLSPG
ncbi:hypothetical protein F53441_4598 [Fusarium austroafricanum]|uniref:AB hydrolase-1 domain-containing protein n=1 Tax=Fusarium austroafricanum TaxID=2364996 RepID=A0A8H4NVC9_9HYPO|nr:hypothetical protein F53441_4598 [Fusarium austroafricanum]